MHSIFYDATVSDDVRRGNLFQGRPYVYSPRPISIELSKLSRVEVRRRGTSKWVLSRSQPRYPEVHEGVAYIPGDECTLA